MFHVKRVRDWIDAFIRRQRSQVWDIRRAQALYRPALAQKPAKDGFQALPAPLEPELVQGPPQPPRFGYFEGWTKLLPKPDDRLRVRVKARSTPREMAPTVETVIAMALCRRGAASALCYCDRPGTRRCLAVSLHNRDAGAIADALYRSGHLRDLA